MWKDGRFVPKESGARVERCGKAEAGADNGKVDEREAIALRNLSMNGRMAMAKLAKEDWDVDDRHKALCEEIGGEI